MSGPTVAEYPRLWRRGRTVRDFPVNNGRVVSYRAHSPGNRVDTLNPFVTAGQHEREMLMRYEVKQPRWELHTQRERRHSHESARRIPIRCQSLHSRLTCTCP